MSIALLYESDEWSTYALRDHIETMGIHLVAANWW